TGRPIDMGGTQLEVLEKRRAVPDLGAVDRGFRPLLEQMLQPNPADRPASMAAVAAWRPQAQMPPPARGAARDHGRAARPTAAATSQAKLGRRLTKVALALALLVGVLSIGFYFAPELLRPLPRPPPEPVLPPEPPADPRPRVIDFVNAYDGGSCFFV